MTTDNGANGASRGEKTPIFTAPAPVLMLVGALWIMLALLILAPPSWAREIDQVLFLEPARFFDARLGWTRFIPLVGHIFAHGGWMHIIFNSLWLLAFGTPVWRRLRGLGMTGFGRASFAVAARPPYVASGLFLTLFLVGGMVGGAVYAGMHPTSTIALVGASGGVSALLGAMVRFAFQRPLMFANELPPLVPLGNRVVLVWSALIVVMNIAVGVFEVGTGSSGADVAWEAHLGGYFFGLLVFPAFDAAARTTTST